MAATDCSVLVQADAAIIECRRAAATLQTSMALVLDSRKRLLDNHTGSRDLIDTRQARPPREGDPG